MICSPTTFPWGTKKAVTLLDQRIKDGVICLPEVELMPSFEDQKDSRYCPYHKREGHTGTRWSSVVLLENFF